MLSAPVEVRKPTGDLALDQQVQPAKGSDFLPRCDAVPAGSGTEPPGIAAKSAFEEDDTTDNAPLVAKAEAAAAEAAAVAAQNDLAAEALRARDLAITSGANHPVAAATGGAARESAYPATAASACVVRGLSLSDGRDGTPAAYRLSLLENTAEVRTATDAELLTKLHEVTGRIQRELQSRTAALEAERAVFEREAGAKRAALVAREFEIIRGSDQLKREQVRKKSGFGRGLGPHSMSRYS